MECKSYLVSVKSTHPNIERNLMKRVLCLTVKDINSRLIPRPHCIFMIPLWKLRRHTSHIINNNLNDNNDIEWQLRNFYGTSNILLRALGLCSYAVKLRLFESYCGFMYTTFLWCDFTKSQYRQLEVAYNNVFWRVMGYDKYCSASSMFVENRTDGFDAGVRKLLFKLVRFLRDCRPLCWYCYK